MYESYNINFTSTLSRSLMEELAGIAVATNTATSIAQVYDQNLNFVCLDDNLFSIELSNSYQTIHDPTTPESKIEAYVTNVTAAIFSVIGTTGRIPIIKCCKGSVAEHIGRKLESKLRDCIMNTRLNIFAEQMHLSRPVLVLMDRSRDLASMLAHSWTYATLFHDILDMKLNRVSTLIEERGRKVMKSFDIEVTDPMWKKMSTLTLPEVAMDIEQETKSYEKTVNNVGVKDGVADVDTDALNSAIQALPELQQKKTVLDMHTALASSLLKSIVDRELDAFISMEESITNTVYELNQSVSTLLTVLQDPKKLPADKLRLFLIFFLSNPEIPDTDVSKLEHALKESQCDISPIQYAKNVKMYSKMTLATLEQHNQTPKGPSVDYLGSFTSNLSKLTESLGSVGISEKLGNFVRDMLPSKKELPVTQVVHAILEGQNNSACLEDYITLDPKAQVSGPSRNQVFKEAIVFMIGGGNYYEYLNLVEHFKVNRI